MNIRSAAAVAFASASFFAGAAFADTNTAGTMRFVVEDFPPFNVIENGAASGPMTEVVKAVCARLHTQCEFLVLPWRRAYRMAFEGMVDGIFVLQRLPERERDFFFTDPVVTTAIGLFALKDAQVRYSTPCSARNHTIGVYGPSATSAAAEQLALSSENVTLVMELDNLTVLRKLLHQRYGERALGALNRHVGNYLLAQHGIREIEWVGDIKELQYAIGLSRKKVSTEQAERFNQALRELIRQNHVKAILEKHGLHAPGTTSVPRNNTTGVVTC